MFARLSALSGYIGIPFGNIVGLLVIWLIKKEETPFVDDQGKEALNFQISNDYLRAGLGCAGSGMHRLCIVVVIGPIFTIIGTVKVNDGESY